MKVTDIGFERFEEDFYAQNTFICGSSATLLNEASTQLSKLNAAAKTVLVTDPYLFPSSPDSTYQSDLIAILKGLNAAKITYCAKSKRNAAFYQQVQTALQAAGTILDYTSQLDDCHDRFWYCAFCGAQWPPVRQRVATLRRSGRGYLVDCWGAFCGAQRQSSAANGSHILGGRGRFNHHGVVLGCTL